MEVTLSIIEELDKIHLNLSHLYLLQQVSLGLSVEKLSQTSIYLTLVRKEFILGGQLTQKGSLLLKKTGNLEGIKEVLETHHKSKESRFDEWWSNYPSTDRVMENGNVKFQETRSLRNGKPVCKIKYEKLLEEGIYTHEQMIQALKYEVDLRVSQSIKENTNKVSFMTNSKTYLNNNMFESFIGMENNIKSINYTTLI